MKILWVCNMALPEIAGQLNVEASNKEGWLSGLIHALLKGEFQNPRPMNDRAKLQIQVAVPVPWECCDSETKICAGEVLIEGKNVEYFGFYEDVQNPHEYEPKLEERMERILKLAAPDMVHCFGTEYPHTLAMCRVIPDKSKILVGIQGICTAIADAYNADLPKEVICSKTLRDVLRKDSIIQQREKFYQRGEHETEAIQLAGNVTGRTWWDKEYCVRVNPNARYFYANETLRPAFYTEQWKEAEAVPHSIFVSQGDYPLKGLHYMLQAMPGILEKYSDTTLYVAGNSLVAYDTWKEKLKISAYGKYLRSLISKYHLEDRVKYLGRLAEGEMLQQYLHSHLFVCCSTLENSSNSLGEAMLLGMPCVCARVGGLPTIFTEGQDGIMFKGFESELTGKDSRCYQIMSEDSDFEAISNALKDAVIEMWSDPGKMQDYCQNARNHARITHDKLINCSKMVEIYAEITSDLCL